MLKMFGNAGKLGIQSVHTHGQNGGICIHSLMINDRVVKLIKIWRMRINLKSAKIGEKSVYAKA